MLPTSCKFCFALVFSCFCTCSDRLFNFRGAYAAEKQRAKRATESAQIAKNAELEVLVRSQAKKITELETAYADLKHEKDNVTTGYQRLATKHNAFAKRVE
jgi:hypothetical protein